MSERPADLGERTKSLAKPLVSRSYSDASTETVLRDFYEVNPPFGNVAIRSQSNVTTYEVIEPTLDEDEKRKIERLKKLLLEEVRAPLSVIYGEDKIEKYLDLNTSRLIKDYKIDIKQDAHDKILYYLKRDFLGYSKIDVLMRDPRIEDISCDGVGIPIYVWHRDYESIPTNVQFPSKEELASFITRLAYKSGGRSLWPSPSWRAACLKGSEPTLPWMRFPREAPLSPSENSGKNRPR